MLFVGVLNLSMAFADEVVQRGVPFILGIGCMASAVYELSKGNRVAYSIMSIARALVPVAALLLGVAWAYWMFPAIYNPSSVRAVVVIGVVVLALYVVRATSRR